MSKWFEKTDAKQLLVYMFGVIIALGVLIYKKDMSVLNEKLTNIASDVKEIKAEQKKDANKFNAKLEKAEFIFETRGDVLEERVREVENSVATIIGESR